MLALDVSSLEMQFPGLAAPVLAIERFHLPAGGRLAITGASGSGKSTFVNAITGLEKVTRGSISWSGTEITHLSSGRRDAFRARNIGLVMQDFHLFPGLSAFDNVVLPVKLARRLTPGERERALKLLSATGIARPQQKIETLSRGEMQRVAVARALLSRPGVVVADEPTASLDRQAGKEVAELLMQLSAEEGTTLIVVTHDAALAARLGRRINLASGRIEEDSQEVAAQ
ncbi:MULTISPECIES: ATP-binding cassette domain-containing protein [Rhizobium]|jgi:putative ABC transport system ATP-binding protein|uniref:ABC transporter ATP-binding protein n=1 Tax=Rhizobium tropici TaxID=398 RepID=A0A329Y2E6_RHITR|nr:MULTISPECIES: ATP-binding cassette domain-containing protein [Rhizobium]MBB3285084.1 putative ABC transport system ATP-binding protein [Rhizobium sp. BK252]MBB3399823.1 putative ABC transport system ATP-binding protein [Rhizobium sp. BK289]MBB3412403.1 putative ABC transport system ATP-binding protein [Rhizobium sp. BK284]MBB3480289.1 putative ABC transport system ATP-binding protein [Rhizobium sp. BK347]MDK4718963.1 ATP-binding cassette domain-containing protein [Rhizobium sp. CNPSo 3968]